MAKLSRKNAIWQFAVHPTKDKGANRVSYSYNGMLGFFKRHRSPDKIFVITHLDTGKKIVATDENHADFYIKTIIARTGLIKDYDRSYKSKPL
jgi:hypothetical protein